MNIYLLRHGETDWNLEGRFQGRMDIPMNDNGGAQIQRSMDALAALSPDVEVILTSPLSRARKSAESAADKLGICRDEIVIAPDFIERAFGEAEGTVTTQMWDEQVIASFAGSEKKDEVCDRAQQALFAAAEQYTGKNILIAAHGAILKAVIAAVLGRQEVYENRRMKLESGCIHLLQYNDGLWSAWKLDQTEGIFREL